MKTKTGCDVRRAMYWSGLLIALSVLILTGCKDERAQSQDPLAPPWPEENAPARLRTLADDLQAFQTATGHLPKILADLDHSGLATGGPYSTLNYAYHPSGIGILRDGWRLVAADDRKCEEHKIWCVVRPPVRIRNLPAFRVTLIPMIELREAAASAGGVK